MAVEAQDELNDALFFSPQLQIGPQSSLPYVALAQIVHSLSQKQQQEIDNYIIDQYKEIGLNIHEQRKRDMSTILHRMESKSRYILIQKEQEIARARNRAAQLELILHKAQIQHQQWQSLALQKEAQAIHLNNTWQQMLQQQQLKTENENDDAESCCDVDSMEKNRRRMLCRACGEREACVVLLPCRHLCACVVCELVIDSCPVCTCLKQGAIHALI